MELMKTIFAFVTGSMKGDSACVKVQLYAWLSPIAVIIPAHALRSDQTGSDQIRMHTVTHMLLQDAVQFDVLWCGDVC